MIVRWQKKNDASMFVCTQIGLIYSLPRTATVRAATHCDLIVVEKTDLYEILKDYPNGEYATILRFAHSACFLQLKYDLTHV